MGDDEVVVLAAARSVRFDGRGVGTRGPAREGVLFGDGSFDDDGFERDLPGVSTATGIRRLARDLGLLDSRGEHAGTHQAGPRAVRRMGGAGLDLPDR